MNKAEAMISMTDQGMHNLWTWGKDGKISTRACERTKFMTNSENIYEEMR